MATDLIQVAALIESRRLVRDPSGVAGRKRRPAAACQKALHANKVIFVFNGGQHKKMPDQRPDPVATLIRCERRISLWPNANDPLPICRPHRRLCSRPLLAHWILV